VTLTPPQNLEDYPKTSITMIPNFVDEEDATLANDQPLSDTESSMPTVYMREPSYYASPTPKKQFNPIFIAMIVGICFVLALIFFSHDSNDQEVQSQDNTQTQSTQNDQNLVKKAPEVIAFLTTKVVKENAVSSTNMKYFDINSPCYTVLDLFSKEPGVVEIRWYRQDHKLRKPIERFEYPGNKALSSTKIVKFTFQENEAGRWYAEVIYQNQILKKIHFDVSK
jgi:hypothetical protein